MTGSPSSAQQLTLMLDWFPNADHAGIYQALAEGDFAKAGLDVHVQVPSDPSVPLKLLAAGKVDAAVSYEPEVLLARDQGLAAGVGGGHRPATADLDRVDRFQAHHDRRAAARQAGRRRRNPLPARVPDHDPRAGRACPLSSVKEINVGDNLVPAMLSGRVDATLGSFWNYEAIQLAMLHKHPNVIHMEQVGVPTYDELVVVVRKNTILSHPDVVRRFVQAMARGYEAVRRDPQAAAANLVKASSGLDPKLQLASIKATLPAFFPSNSADPWGWQDPKQWTGYGQWMLKNRLISNPNAAIDASTNELLAGQGLL